MEEPGLEKTEKNKNKISMSKKLSDGRNADLSDGQNVRHPTINLCACDFLSSF
jgi:hypothetical protein